MLTPNDSWASLCKLCAIPQCLPEAKPVAEQLVWALAEVARLRTELLKVRRELEEISNAARVAASTEEDNP